MDLDPNATAAVAAAKAAATAVASGVLPRHFPSTLVPADDVDGLWDLGNR